MKNFIFIIKYTKKLSTSFFTVSDKNNNYVFIFWYSFELSRTNSRKSSNLIKWL